MIVGIAIGTVFGWTLACICTVAAKDRWFR